MVSSARLRTTASGSAHADSKDPPGVLRPFTTLVPFRTTSAILLVVPLKDAVQNRVFRRQLVQKHKGSRVVSQDCEPNEVHHAGGDVNRLQRPLLVEIVEDVQSRFIDHSSSEVRRGMHVPVQLLPASFVVVPDLLLVFRERE